MANTIADKLTYLNGTKYAIKQAIIGKGVSVTDTDTFRSYADKITSIQSGGGGGTGSLVTGTKLAYSTFSTIPDEYIPYLEQQTDMSNMFSYCASLQTVQLFNTSNVTTMDRMFSDCELLETVSQLDTSRVNDMGYMFSYCFSLTSVPLLSTKNVNNMTSMFDTCRSLTTVPQFDTSSLTNAESMFYDCSNLQTVPLLNFSSVNNNYNMFDSCTSLTNLGGFTGLKIDLDLQSNPLLTVDSIMNIINNAADMSSEPKILTLHQDVFNKLSQEQIATATAKGWNIESA